jgi:hypothetical protein
MSVMTGAIALIKVKGNVIGKMKSIRAEESFRRQPVKGLGTIIASEYPVTDFEGTLSCEFFSIDLKNDGLTGAIMREFSNVSSRVLTGGDSFEDQMVLEETGIQIDIFKKVTDVIDTNGIIKPKLIPYASINRAFIESDSFDISEGQISGHSQRFKYLSPIIRAK